MYICCSSSSRHHCHKMPYSHRLAVLGLVLPRLVLTRDRMSEVFLFYSNLETLMCLLLNNQLLIN